MVAPGNGNPGTSPRESTDGSGVIRIAALGDLHCTDAARGVYQPLFQRIAESADIMVLCGDLTDYGHAAEAKVLASELSAVDRVPTIAVLGNHDVESGQGDEVRRILEHAGVMFLDGDAKEIKGIGFAGAKGFAGGFGRGTLGSFGERTVKLFVQEAIDEALKLESALARLRTPHRIAVLHYSPIKATVENEPPEIFAFLGCSRLEEPLNRYQVTAVVHGHAHNGTPEGKTTAGVPVYNVALPLMRKAYPGNPPFRILDIATKADSAAGTRTGQQPINAALGEQPVHSAVG